MNNFLFLLILISLSILSCKNANNSFAQEEKSHMKLHEEMDKVDEEYQKFEKVLVNLYSESEKNPDKVIVKADSLLIINKSEKGKYKSQIKSSVESSLHRLKAELFYRLGKYSESITEIETDDYISGDEATRLAANYIKLNNKTKAKSFIDKIGKGFYIYDYALANYYESIGNKAEALKIYDSIKQNKEIKHYAYYKLAVNRFEELQKSNPKLLNEIYFPTGNPSFEIADSDNENRTKIMKTIISFPEVIEKECGVWIYESPQTNDKDYYWIKAGKGDLDESYKTDFNFFVYMNPFVVKYYDEKNNKTYSLEEWRSKK